MGGGGDALERGEDGEEEREDGEEDDERELREERLHNGSDSRAGMPKTEKEGGGGGEDSTEMGKSF